MSVWDELVGQGPVVESLQDVVANPAAMTHAWLFTGPPGSGRSNAAKAFAAALQCPTGGCGRCESCTMVADGTHPDVSLVRTDGLSIGVDTAREYVRRGSACHAVNETYRCSHSLMRCVLLGARASRPQGVTARRYACGRDARDPRSSEFWLP